MAYQGISPYLYRNNLTNVQLLDDISGSFNGTTTQFNLTTNGSQFHAVSARSLVIVLGGIIQEPDADYTVNAGVITFTTAPASGLTFSARNIYGLNAINNVNDGVITHAKLTTGGPSWDTSGNLTITGDLIANSLGDVVNLASIDKSITDTATDVFVYDTRKDSDGGAWRKRTQHTSWYNETLNTATRGSRREFPAVAVIVAKGDDTITIYDGDDPDLPMWMVMPVLTGWDSTTKVSALNGIIVMTNHGYNGTMFHVKFIEDSYNLYDCRPAVSLNSYTSRISDRATVASYSGTQISNIPLANADINDVAMIVLPNAPIDETTGLPVPTIAVATDGGISIIKDDGTVSSKTITGGIANHYIDFLDNGNIVVEQGYQYTTVLLDYTAESQAYTSSLSNTEQYTDSYTGWVELRFPYLAAGGTGVSGNYKLTSFKNNFASAHSGGLVLVDRNAVSPSNGMTAGISTNFNTGWMHGDIKGAFLSDTDATNVIGTELWPEGDFADANEWSSAGAEWTISGGTATVSDADGGYSFLGSSSGTLTNGKKYVLSFTVSNYSGGRLEAAQANSNNIQIPFSANGSYSQLINYTGTSGSGLAMYGYGGGAVGFTLDNLYLRELEEEDRSVNNTGLAVYGTITKSAVATGADLIAYSGWSSSNYLRRPYDSSIDNPGSGDYSIIFWAKSSNTHTGVIWSIRSPSNPGNNWMQLWFDNSYLTFLQTGGTTLQTTSVNYYNNQWNCYTIVKSSGIGYMYENGVLKTSSSLNADPGLLSTCTYSVGVHYDNQYPVQGSLALLRYSLSAPSPEQIKKIYEDEKVLFQENAACTLYGSSDAVTALSYDDSTNLLYAGTSSGRSDFQGLRRINNTTTAVTTAMSASNGLVAEQ